MASTVVSTTKVEGEGAGVNVHGINTNGGRITVFSVARREEEDVWFPHFLAPDSPTLISEARDFMRAELAAQGVSPTTAQVIISRAELLI